MFKTHKAIKIIGILFLFFAISAFSTNMSNKESLATLKEEYKANLEKLEEVKSNEEEVYAKYTEARENYNTVKEDYDTVKSKYDKIQEKLEEIEAEKKRKAEEKAAEEKRKAEEKAEKEKYNTGITYNQLNRNPDDYVGEYVKFSGKVIQVSEGLFSNVWRLNVNGNYNQTLYLTVPSSLTTNNRVVEDDWVTIYGVSEGIETYTTIFGASVSIPSVSVDKISR